MRRWSGSSSNLNWIIFDLKAVVSNFAVNFAHKWIGSFFQCSVCMCRLRLEWLSSDESESSESSLEDGSDSYVCLRRLFRILFFLIFLLLRLESDDDDESSDKSDGGGSGSDFTFDLCFSQFCVEIGSDRVGTSIGSDRVGTSSILSERKLSGKILSGKILNLKNSWFD